MDTSLVVCVKMPFPSLERVIELEQRNLLLQGQSPVEPVCGALHLSVSNLSLLCSYKAPIPARDSS